jgi:hypothetical protein
MSYYILPKINNLISINPTDSGDIIPPYSSHSLYNYYNSFVEQIDQICNSEIDRIKFNYKELIKIIHPFEYIFSKVPGNKYSVSKLKPSTNMFYDLFEICSTLNILESYTNKITTLHISKTNDTVNCIEMIRENYSDDLTFYDKVNDNLLKNTYVKKFDFLFFETDINNNLNEYFISLIKNVMIILKNQEYGGTSIIKINSIFHKPVYDILYLLSSIYEKVHIIKPNTSNITTFDKYIVCKNFNTNNNTNLKYNYYKLMVFLKKIEDKNVVSILDNSMPYYFLSKINDMNVIIGQQQLEYLNLIINFLKNKNKEEKIEIIKKNNINKCIAWCEKYNIPCNKFIEKINIFLPENKEQEQDGEENKEKEQEQEQDL